VASTNVYGDIARQIAGPSAHVTSILSDPNADPHLFEARTSNGLAVARAKVVIANGLGYGAPFTAATLQVGSIGLTNVTMSINKAPMSTSLLGMAFFNRMKSFRVEGDRLYIRPR